MSVIDLVYAAGAPSVVACPRCTMFTIDTGFGHVDANDPIVAQELGVFVVKQTCRNCGIVARIRVRCSTVVESIVEVSS